MTSEVHTNYKYLLNFFSMITCYISCKVDLWKQVLPGAIWFVFKEHDLNLIGLKNLLKF